MTLYNVFMCLYSLTTFVLSVSALRAGKGLFTPFASDVSAAPGYQILVYFFFLSKYVEYLDTIFLIVSGKPVSFLQYCEMFVFFPVFLSCAFKTNNIYSIFQ